MSGAVISTGAGPKGRPHPRHFETGARGAAAEKPHRQVLLTVMPGRFRASGRTVHGWPGVGAA